MLCYLVRYNNHVFHTRGARYVKHNAVLQTQQGTVDLLNNCFFPHIVPFFNFNAVFTLQLAQQLLFPHTPLALDKKSQETKFVPWRNFYKMMRLPNISTKTNV